MEGSVENIDALTKLFVDWGDGLQRIRDQSEQLSLENLNKISDTQQFLNKVGMRDNLITKQTIRC